MLTELLKPTGPELARRWVAALLLAPQRDREAIVEQVEAKIASTYAEDADDPPQADELLLHVANEPVVKDGQIEQTIRTYARSDDFENDDESDAQNRRDVV